MEKYQYKPKKVKFRGKAVENGNKWTYGFLISYVNTRNGISERHFAIGDDWKFEKVDKKTIGQATGIKDVNGKMIFEGDIIIGRGRNDWNENVEKKFIVKPFDQMRTSFRDWFYFEEPEFEIIGNVFENPKLAEEVFILSKNPLITKQ
ncbi:MAG: YopX family protein [Bacteroidales bacterium]|nr:YopX family protein [Bacteroidales bacterium]